MMFVMADSNRYGYLANHGVPIPPESVAQRVGCTLELYTTLLAELDRASVPSRTSNGIIYSRKMVRMAKERQKKKRQDAERARAYRARHANVTHESRFSSYSDASSECRDPSRGEERVSESPPPDKPLSHKFSPQFFDAVQKRKAYSHLDVRFVFEKYEAWCDARNIEPEETKFLGWLNREDQPRKGNGSGDDDRGTNDQAVRVAASLGGDH
jgi:hypothetical protein